MLRRYPVAATQDNWLHDAVINLVILIHHKLDVGESVNNNQPTWLALVNSAVAVEKRNIIKGFTGLRDKLFAYKDELVNLTAVQRSSILGAIETQNSIEGLLDGTVGVQLINVSYPSVHEKAKELFTFCFLKLSDLDLRTKQYKLIFSSLADKICPFCGIERVMNPDETAQDQDHYLAKSIYPFAATNMRNLVPMCRCCNRDYKKDIDVIKSADGLRRLAFDPYTCTSPVLSLAPSTLVRNSSPITFDWKIEFLSEQERSETWDSVFSIRTRYKRDILDQYFDRWLRGFTDKCAKERARGRVPVQAGGDKVRDTLQFYQEDKAEHPSIGLAGFLEPLAFSLLLKMYDDGEERIVSFIRDAVLGMAPEDVA